MAMDMHIRAVQKLSQRMQMSPQLYQVIEILQLPVLELQKRLETEVDQNPFLEVDEGADAELKGVTKELPVEGSKEAEQIERNKENKEVLEALREEYEAFATFSKPTFSGDEDPKLEAMMNTAAPGISLPEHLLPQIHLMDLSIDVASAAEILVSVFDKKGYLPEDYKEVIADISRQLSDFTEKEGIVVHFSDEVIEEARKVVRTLDPSGVGATNLVECLTIQLEAQEEELDIEKLVVSNHLYELAANKLPEIASVLGVSVDRINTALDNIKKLNPSPGLEFADDTPQYIVADVIIKERSGELEVSLNQASMPKFRFNAHLFETLKRKILQKNDKKFVSDKKEAAKSLLNALDQRNRILFRIAEAIVEHQNGYFKRGRKYIRPLLMKDLADELSIDVSTVSRAVSGKYMDCPQGIIALREMFTAGYRKMDGDEVSDEAIKENLKHIVLHEEKSKPYSDQAITDLLKKEGINISRRTVTKYREELEIANSRLRKKH